jgi:hypothetical protein
MGTKRTKLPVTKPSYRPVFDGAGVYMVAGNSEVRIGRVVFHGNNVTIEIDAVPINGKLFIW